MLGKGKRGVRAHALVRSVDLTKQEVDESLATLARKWLEGDEENARKGVMSRKSAKLLQARTAGSRGHRCDKQARAPPCTRLASRFSYMLGSQNTARS